MIPLKMFHFQRNYFFAKKLVDDCKMLRAYWYFITWIMLHVEYRYGRTFALSLTFKHTFLIITVFSWNLPVLHLVNLHCSPIVRFAPIVKEQKMFVLLIWFVNWLNAMNHRYMYAELSVLANQNDSKVYDCMNKFLKSRKFQMPYRLSLLFERINRQKAW